MKEFDARQQGYRCAVHKTPLEEVRGDYYCPECLAEKIDNVPRVSIKNTSTGFLTASQER